MKKLISVLVLFLLVGCSDAYATLSTDEVLFEVNGVSVTQKQLFTQHKAADSGSLAIEEAQAVITKDISDESIQEEADALLAKQKEDMGELFELQLKSSGYSSEEDYMERSIKPYLKLKTLISNQLKEDYVDFATNYLPKELQILQLENREKANEAIEALSAGKTFDEVAEEYKSGTTYVGESKIYMMNDTKIPSEISKFVLETNEPKLSGLLETTTGTVSFYIVNVVEPAADKIQDKAIEAALDISELTQKHIAKMYREAGFKVYDKAIYDLLQKDFSDYLAN